MLYLHLFQNLLCVLVVVATDLILSLQHGRAELSRECLGHLHRLTDSRALDDDILDLVQLRQTC